MEGLLASATLYGEFMEKYVYSESAVDNKALIETHDMTSDICIDPQPAENILAPCRKQWKRDLMSHHFCGISA